MKGCACLLAGLEFGDLVRTRVVGLVGPRDDAEAPVAIRRGSQSQADVDEVAAHVSVVEVVGQVVVALAVGGAGAAVEVEALAAFPLQEDQRGVVQAVSLAHQLMQGWEDVGVAKEVPEHLCPGPKRTAVTISKRCMAASSCHDGGIQTTIGV